MGREGSSQRRCLSAALGRLVLLVRYSTEKEVGGSISSGENKLSKGTELQHRECGREMQAIWCSWNMKSEVGHFQRKSSFFVEELMQKP